MSRCWIRLEVVLFGIACSDIKLFSKQLVKKSQRTQFLYLSQLPPFYLSPKEKPAYLSGILLTCQGLNSSRGGQILQLNGFTRGWLSVSIRWTMTLRSNLLLTCHSSIDYYYQSVSRWSCFIRKVLNLHLLHLCDRDMVWTWEESKGDMKSYSYSLEIPTPLLWMSWWIMFEAFLTSWLPYICNFYWLLHSFIKYLLRLFIKF